MLPIDVASAVAGWTIEIVGPFTGAHHIADRNIRTALPELTDDERRGVLRAMWNNMGRIAGEYVHLKCLAESPTRVQIDDPQGLFARAASERTGALVLSAHFGNWEIFCLPGCRAGATQFDVYRAANNPGVDRLLKHARSDLTRGGLIAKGPAAMRESVSCLRKGHYVGMLVDQKINEGISVEFFGRKAMTTRAPALLAYRLGCPIFVVLVERIRGARFVIHVHEMNVERSGNLGDDVERTTRDINAVLEAAIRAKPEMWMWVHRRWPD
jgi:KDO2-lipid IV(A) lauroyltransferase